MHKLIWIDVETGGLDEKKNPLIQVAAFVEIGGEIKDKFVSYIRPFPMDIVEPKALEVNKLTMDQLKAFPEPRAVYLKFISFLDNYINRYDSSDKLVPLGYNVSFDMGFLREFWLKNGDKYFGSYFLHVPVDVMGLVVAHSIMLDIPLPSRMRLTDQIKFFGLEVEGDLHDAEVDIRMTREVFLKVKEKLLTRKEPNA